MQLRDLPGFSMLRSILIGQILICLMNSLVGQKAYSVSTPLHFRGLWCITQWNEKTESYSEQIGQAFFYNNATFTWNFLSDISLTWSNQFLSIERSQESSVYQVTVLTSRGPSPFFNRTSNCSLRQESNGDITWHVQSKGVPTSSLDKVPLKTSLYYTRNREHCRLFNDEGSHRELSKTKFEKTLLSFDRSLPFENRKAVVFYGSSSIRFWASLKSDFSNLPNGVINRGFGGSTLDDCWRQFKRLIVPLEPHALIIYVGENDRTSKRSAPQIELTFLELISTVRRFFPCIPIAYISIIPSLNPLDEFITRIEVNQRLRIAIESLPNVDYINVYDEMLTAEGAVRPELYDLDQLHMNEYGYAIWARVLTEYFETKRIAPSVDPSYAFWVAVIKLIIICQCVFGLMILYMRIRPRRWNHGIACRRLHRFCVRLITRRGLY